MLRLSRVQKCFSHRYKASLNCIKKKKRSRFKNPLKHFKEGGEAMPPKPLLRTARHTPPSHDDDLFPNRNVKQRKSEKSESAHCPRLLGEGKSSCARDSVARDAAPAQPSHVATLCVRRRARKPAVGTTMPP